MFWWIAIYIYIRAQWHPSERRILLSSIVAFSLLKFFSVFFELLQYVENGIETKRKKLNINLEFTIPHYFHCKNWAYTKLVLKAGICIHRMMIEDGGFLYIKKQYIYTDVEYVMIDRDLWDDIGLQFSNFGSFCWLNTNNKMGVI